MGMKFHFTGPLKLMSAEQIWDSITTLILEVDSYAPTRAHPRPNRPNEGIYQSLEGRPIEEVLPRIRKPGTILEIRSQQVEYEKKISSAYAQSLELAKKLTDELREKSVIWKPETANWS